jgi:hypothetical protein
MTIEIPFQGQVFGHLKKEHGIENGAERYLYHEVCIMGFVLWGFLSMQFLCICLEFLKSIHFGCYIEMQL